MLPKSLQGVDFGATMSATPARPAGYGKGSKETPLTNAANLVKLVHALATGGSLSGMNPDTVDALYKQVGMKAPVGGLKSIIGDVGAMFSSAVAGPKGAANTGTAAGHDFHARTLDASDRQVLYEAAWKDMAQASNSIIGLPESLKTPPKMANAVKTLQTIGNFPVMQATKIELGDSGWANVGPNYSFKDMISDQDEFQKGAPGGKGSAAIPNAQTMSGSQFYSEFRNAYNSGAGWATSMATEMEGAGLIDMSGLNGATQPSAEMVGQGVITLLQQAQTAEKNGKPVGLTTILTNAYNGKTPEGLPLTVAAGGASPDDAYVEHVAAQVGVQLTKPQLHSIATQMYAQGSTNVNTEDWVNKAVTDAAAFNLNNQVESGNAPAQDGYDGWASAAAQAVTQAYAGQGIELSNKQLATIVSGVLGSGVTSVYSTIDQAGAYAADGFVNSKGQAVPGAKQQAATNVGGQDTYLGQQIMNGQTLAQLSSPYFTVAQNTLGVPAADITPTNPLYMKWQTGGPGGGPMSTSAYAQMLMTDPAYGYEKSQESKATGSAGVMGIAGLMGISPAGSSVLPSSGSTAGVEQP
jgi:hypothetical protein